MSSHHPLHLLLLCTLVLLISLITTPALARGGKDRPHCPKRCVCRGEAAWCDSMLLTSLPRLRGAPYDTVYLRDNLIRRLGGARLQGYTQVRHLLLKGNQIHHVEAHAFAGMHKLVSLSLTHNHLRSLNKDAFAGLVMLQVFSLRDNRINNVDGRFVSLHNLQLLNLANNEISRITDKTFKGNPLLRVLDLHNNSLSYIEKHAFRPLPFLKFLVLRDNPIGVIEFDFRGNFHLELLDLTNCHLTQMVRGLPHSVNDLRIAENNITELLPEHFRTTKKIRLLDMNRNQVAYIAPDALKNLWELWDFYIGGNRIQEIPKNIPQNLRGFYASHNNISHLGEHMFPHRSRLENLYLKNNDINGVERDALRDLKHLKSLDLSRNSLVNVAPYTFTNLSKLEVLDLSRNPINELPRKSFHGLKKLHILQLNSVGSKNAQSSVQETVFEDTNHLLFLDISNSSALAHQLAENPSMLNYLHSVVDLNLMDDELASLPPNFPLFFPNLKVVKLTGNPWHCDGNIWWMSEWLRSNQISFFAPERMQCATPKNLDKKPLANLRPEDLFTEEEMIERGITLTPMPRSKKRKQRPTASMKTVTRFGKNFTINVEVVTHSTNFGIKPTEAPVIETTPEATTTTTVPTTTTTTPQPTTTQPTTTTTTTTTTTPPTTTTTTTTPKPTTTTTTTTTTTLPTTTTTQPTTTTPEPTTTTQPTTTTTRATTTTTTTQPPPTTHPGGSINILGGLLHNKNPPPASKKRLPSRFAPSNPWNPNLVKNEYNEFYAAKERLNRRHKGFLFNKQFKLVKHSERTGNAGHNGHRDSNLQKTEAETEKPPPAERRKDAQKPKKAPRNKALESNELVTSKPKVNKKHLRSETVTSTTTPQIIKASNERDDSKSNDKRHSKSETVLDVSNERDDSNSNGKKKHAKSETVLDISIESDNSKSNDKKHAKSTTTDDPSESDNSMHAKSTTDESKESDNSKPNGKKHAKSQTTVESEESDNSQSQTTDDPNELEDRSNSGYALINDDEDGLFQGNEMFLF